MICKSNNSKMRRFFYIFTHILPYFIQTIWFNLRYLPFNQAIKLPILLYKPRFITCKGIVRIEGKIKTGMIRLGFPTVPLYSNSGIVWECMGTMVFRGPCSMGNNTALSVGSSGFLDIGSEFSSTCGLKLVCWKKIIFRNSVTLGWDCMISDIAFHSLKYIEGGKSKGCGVIEIGSNNWICMRSIILYNTITPDYCVIGAGSLLNKDYTSLGERILIAGNPAILKRSGVYFDSKDCEVDYD